MAIAPWRLCYLHLSELWLLFTIAIYVDGRNWTQELDSKHITFWNMSSCLMEMKNPS